MIFPTAIVHAEYVAEARNQLARRVTRLEKKPDTTRRTRNYGYDFDLLKEGDRTFADFPPALFRLCAETILQLETVTGKKLPAPEAFTNCIVSDYEPDFRLKPHIDVNRDRAERFNSGFYFGPVIGVVLIADTLPKNTPPSSPRGTLYLLDEKKQKHPLDEVDGMAFLLDGPNRDRYPHGVDVVHTRRLSVTFRTVEFTR